MSPRSFGLSPEVQAYVVDHSTPPDDVQRRLIERTAALGGVSGMQISPEQGALLTVLTATVRPSFAVEVGTFTGYSALSIAKGLPPGGRLLCCDVSEEWTAIAREHWAEAGVADRIELRIGPGLDTLRSLPADRSVDLAFIDADKPGYVDYYEELLPRLSTTGLIAVDNTLWSGRVADPDVTDDQTAHIRDFNDHVVADPRSDVAMVPIGDGLTLIRRVDAAEAT